MRNATAARLFSSALLIFAISAFAFAAARQPAKLGSVSGRVFSAQGFAVQGALVTLQTSDGKSPRSMRTNSQGHYAFTLLLDGMYDVRASAKGRSTEWRRNIVVRGGRDESVNLHLQPEPRPTKTPTSMKKK